MDCIEKYMEKSEAAMAQLENLRELVVFTKVRTFDGNTHDLNFF